MARRARSRRMDYRVVAVVSLVAVWACGGADPTQGQPDQDTVVTTEEILPPENSAASSTAASVTTEAVTTTATLVDPLVLSPEDAPEGTTFVPVLGDDPLALIPLTPSAQAILDQYEIVHTAVAVYVPSETVDPDATSPDETVVVSGALVFSTEQDAAMALEELWSDFIDGPPLPFDGYSVSLPGEDGRAFTTGGVTILIWRTGPLVFVLSLTGPDIDKLASELPMGIGR